MNIPADRLAIPNWQNAGLISKGGPSGAGITAVGGGRSVFTTVSPSGLQDSTDVNAINTAITNAINAGGNNVVALASGQFYIGPGNNFIFVNGSITLRGAGAGSTIITKVDGCRLETPFTGSQTGTVMTVTAMLGGRNLLVGDPIQRQLTSDVPGGDNISSFGTGSGQTGTYNMAVSANVTSGTLQAGKSTGSNASPAIVVGTSRDLCRWGDPTATANSTNLTADASHGDLSITVASTTNFSVGQFVLIDQVTAAQWLACTLPGNDIAAVLTATVSGTTMNVTAIGPGSFGTGVLRQYMTLAGPGIPAGTFVVKQTSGTAGSTGNYTISQSLTISTPETINAGYTMWCEPGARLMWRKQRPAMTTGGNENFGWGIVSGTISGTTFTLSSTDAGGFVANYTLTPTGQVPSPNDPTLTGGPTTWTLSSAPGNATGQFEVHQWPNTPPPSPGGVPGDYYHRLGRPWCEVKEIKSIVGNTITFTSPIMFPYQMSLSAQMTFADLSDGVPHPHVTNAGVENLTIEQGDNGNISFRFAAYSWVKNVESRIYNGHCVNFQGCFRCELRHTYIHDACFPQPGGGAYNIAFEAASSEILIEDCISILGDKTMTSLASGAGSVVAYNYMDQQYIDYTGDGTGHCWMETGINSSHAAGSHHVLFEGNQGPNGDSDNNHGCSGHAVHLRNYYTIFRRPFLNLRNGITYDDTTVVNMPMRAAATQSYNINMTYVGNVLGTQGKMGSYPFVYDDPRSGDPAVWMLGWDNNETPSRTSEPLARASCIRDGNWDWLQSVQSWHYTPTKYTISNSLYLSAKPSFFASNNWPWVDPASGTTYTLPAQARFNSGNPNGP